MEETGTLFLVPTPLGEHISSLFYDSYYQSILDRTRYFIVEETKTARRFIRRIIPDFPIDDSIFMVFNEHTVLNKVDEFILPLQNGKDVCMLSEAGCPAVADPGYPIVTAAHRHQIRVVPLIGPSSIMLALMASGFPAQQFLFNGYLPVKSEERKKKIVFIEQQSHQQQLTQIFIETPYRNKSMYEDLIKICHSYTMLCIACQLTQPDEFIKTMSMSEWKKQNWEIPKSPAIFVLFST